MALWNPTDVEEDIRLTGGDAVVFGGVTTYGHVDYGDEDGLDGDGNLIMVTRVRSVLIATGILSSIDRGESIVIGITDTGTPVNTTFIITDHRAENDGLETRLMLGDNA